MSNDYRVIFNENSTHDSEPNVTPTILPLLRKNYPFLMELQVPRDLKLPKYASKLLLLKFLNIEVLIDIEMHRK